MRHSVYNIMAMALFIGDPYHRTTSQTILLTIDGQLHIIVYALILR